MIEGSFVARKVNEEPPSYRVWFDDGTGEVEVGSISERKRHTGHHETYWLWGVDTFPLAKGNAEGVAWSHEAAREAFRKAFLIWVNNLDPGQWESNRDYKRANAESLRVR
jgi:hypothetical protein